MAKATEQKKKRTATTKPSSTRGSTKIGMKSHTTRQSQSGKKKTAASAASTARGYRANSSASMPKGVSGRIDQRRDGTYVTEPPKSSARAKVGDAYIARDGVRNTLTGELISKPKSNGKRYLPVDHGAVSGLPAGATSAKYDSYTGKYVPVYTSGSKKKK